MNKVINDYRNYFIHRRKMLIDELSEGEFKAFLLGMECAALYSDNMKYYSELMVIIDRYREEMKNEENNIKASAELVTSY